MYNRSMRLIMIRKLTKSTSPTTRLIMDSINQPRLAARKRHADTTTVRKMLVSIRWPFTTHYRLMPMIAHTLLNIIRVKHRLELVNNIHAALRNTRTLLHSLSLRRRHHRLTIRLTSFTTRSMRIRRPRRRSLSIGTLSHDGCVIEGRGTER